MKKSVVLVALLLVLAEWAMAGPGRVAVQVQAGASMLGAGSEPRFSLGWFGTMLDSSTRQRWDGDFDAVVGRAAWARVSMSWRPLDRLAAVLSLDAGSPLGYVERHDVQMGAFWGVSSSRPEIPLAAEGYLVCPALAVRVYLHTGATEPYIELGQGYMWQVLDVWWDPSGVQLPGFRYRIHHRHRAARPSMRAALGLAHSVSPSMQAHALVEWLSTRNGPGGSYFLDWDRVHQRFDLSVGVSYAF
ncbi:MAG: hypothetical protein H5U38_01735 [Calditrichaeota bacterium]|nr:hypothetical protein [Calditrichota bacterium]